MWQQGPLPSTGSALSFSYHMWIINLRIETTAGWCPGKEWHLLVLCSSTASSITITMSQSHLKDSRRPDNVPFSDSCAESNEHFPIYGTVFSDFSGCVTHSLAKVMGTVGTFFLQLLIALNAPALQYPRRRCGTNVPPISSNQNKPIYIYIPAPRERFRHANLMYMSLVCAGGGVSWPTKEHIGRLCESAFENCYDRDNERGWERRKIKREKKKLILVPVKHQILASFVAMEELRLRVISLGLITCVSTQPIDSLNAMTWELAAGVRVTPSIP